VPDHKPLFIAVEGPIGVGKTTLVNLLADALGARRLLEVVEENPFLPDFYRDRERYAFQTQLFFLLSRFKQQSEILQEDLFSPGVVSDYMLEKDRLFATMNLNRMEMALYDRLWSILGPRAPRPDLVVLLLARIEVLLARIARRGREFEQSINRSYLEEVTAVYSEYFHKYAESPLLVVDNSEVDYVHDEKQREHLLATIREHRSGIKHFKPLGS
jgi:deoxyadenosine/deoxycytidine kinase